MVVEKRNKPLASVILKKMFSNEKFVLEGGFGHFFQPTSWRITVTFFPH